MNCWHSTACYRWREGSVGDCWCLETNEEIMNTHRLTHPSYVSATWLSMSLIFLMQIHTLSSSDSISYVSWSMNEDLQQPQPHYWDQHDLSDLLLHAIVKRGVIYIVFVLFEVHMANMYLNGLKRRRGRVHIKVYYCSVVCILFKQRTTTSYSYSSIDSKGLAELCMICREAEGTKEEYERAKDISVAN